MNEIIPQDVIEQKIFLMRCQKVMLDRDLAVLYSVETKILNKAVRRNIERFPPDFMFQLTKEEFDNLKFQFGTSSWGGTRKLPLVFTENGVAMLSSVLNSKRAIQVNIQIMRTFTKIRKMLASNAQLARKLKALEKKYDKQFAIVFEAIYKLMTPPKKEQRKIGFKREKE
jgi:hypothetical protein